MYAVVNTGGKQLKVAVGDTVSVEKLDAAPGATVKLTALLVNDGEKIIVGDEAAAIDITGEVLGHGKGDKVIVFKFKKRKGYKRTKGHRQQLTLLKVTDIGVAGKKVKKAETEPEAADKASEKPAAKAPAAKKPVAKAAPKPKAEAAKAAPKPEAKPAAKAAAKPAAEKKAPAAKPAEKKAPAAKKPAAAKKPVAKKPAAPKKDKPAG